MTYDDMDKQKKLIELSVIDTQNSIRKISIDRLERKQHRIT
jgi:hypothetical protein